MPPTKMESRRHSLWWAAGAERLELTVRALATTAAAGPDVKSAVEDFRRRAGPEILAAADAKAGGSPYHLQHKLRDVSGKTLAAAFGEASSGEEAPKDDAAAVTREGCEKLIQEELEKAVSLASSVQENHKERQKLKMARADVLAVGFQTIPAENQEFGSLIVCATAGIFAVTIHYVFFSIWLLAYMLYRRSTKQTRIQRAASDDLGGLTERLRELDSMDKEQRAALRTLAEAWSVGHAG